MATVRNRNGSVSGYVRKSILTFKSDPADTSFQRGYLNALFDVWDYATDGSRDDTDIEAVRPRNGSADKLPDVSLQ